MAQPILCDGGHEDVTPADILLTRLDGTSAAAFCDACYLLLCRSVVDQVDAAEREAAEAEALARLQALGTATPADEGGPYREVAPDVDGTRGQRPDPNTATVVRRGTSRSRQAHEARQRERAERSDAERAADLAAMTADPAGGPADLDPGVTPDPER